MRCCIIFLFITTYWTFGCKTEEPQKDFFQNGYIKIVEVKSKKTGRIWMDRNLDFGYNYDSGLEASFPGDLYQWGRLTDGHQIRNSNTTQIKSKNNSPGNSSFIIGKDWLTISNNNLWQGIKGINNVCPSGYRLPTIEEWENEIKGFNYINGNFGAIENFATIGESFTLKISGFRDSVNGIIKNSGEEAYYWSSTTKGEFSVALRLSFFEGISVVNINRATGGCVRCIKN
jgi:uncharacterized protein (TIGR02145 family)